MVSGLYHRLALPSGLRALRGLLQAGDEKTHDATLATSFGCRYLLRLLHFRATELSARGWVAFFPSEKIALKEIDPVFPRVRMTTMSRATVGLTTLPY